MTVQPRLFHQGRRITVQDAFDQGIITEAGGMLQGVVLLTTRDLKMFFTFCCLES